ncbi:MAG: hypothetical protein NXI31_24395 [bacterium]|nr:hypothetical protein [bacterium]
MGHSLVVGRIIVLVGLAAAPRGQEVWRLAERGAAEYSRQTSARCSAVVRDVRRARAAPLTAKVPERLAPTAAPAPFVCAGELAPDRRRLLGSVRDLRDVLRSVACDLRGGTARFDGLVPYGDVVVGASFGRAVADGSQQARGSIRCRPPRSDRLRAFCCEGATGMVQVTRRFDSELGVVASFQGSIDLVVEVGVRKFRRVVVTDSWQFVALRDNRDTDFRLRVAAAIGSGVGFVRRALETGRSYLDGRVAERRSYGSGRLALALLTLLAAQIEADDPTVERGFAELRRRRLVDSYSLAAALMASARLLNELRREPTAAESKAMERWLRQLQKNVDPRVDASQLLRFNYVPGPRYDTSVQQYGLLGLRAAQRAGLEVQATAFAAAARQLLAVQCPSAGRRAHHVVTAAELGAAAGAAVRGRNVRSACRGFAYVDPDEPAFGSMTAAGTSGLLLARAGLEAAGHRDRALVRRLDRALDDGFGWLAKELSLRVNPGFAERGRFHWYYWLYCLERSCQLADIAWLDGRDWYYEGALQLLGQQQKSGAFRCGGAADLQIDATCFAILFLAKASGRAAITQGR